MTDKNVLSTLKAQWVILKDETASNQDKVNAYQIINSLQNQHKNDPDFKYIDLSNTRYKIYSSIETANSSPKPAPTSTEAKSSQITSGGANKFNELIANFEFKELTDKEQEMTEKKARAIFETKIIVAKVASEPQFAGLGFDNVQSVGQVTGLVREN